MKIILSRKGFDSEYGKMPSPILPDGTLLSMPIPSSKSTMEYSSLTYNDKTYLQIAQELNPKFNYKYCHLDPDIREKITARTNDWQPLFGQCGAAQGHLSNNLINTGDIFLFFGWFKSTEYDSNGKLRFVKNAPELNVIYGYLQINEIISDNEIINKNFNWHPHADLRHFSMNNNCIYSATRCLTIDKNLIGFGTLNMETKRVLTKVGMTRTKWDLPDIFKKVSITYHNENNFKDEYFQSASRGQEFVISENNDIVNWALNIIKE